MIILYNFYKLISLHQNIFNYTSFETVLSFNAIKMNLCCKKSELFGNLLVRKTFINERHLKLTFL